MVTDWSLSGSWPLKPELESPFADRASGDEVGDHLGAFLLIDPLSGERFVRETHQFSEESFSLDGVVGHLCFDLEPPRFVCFLAHFVCHRSGVKAWTRPSISLRTIWKRGEARRIRVARLSRRAFDASIELFLSAFDRVTEISAEGAGYCSPGQGVRSADDATLGKKPDSTGEP
jgi:hypothetical protein